MRASLFATVALVALGAASAAPLALAGDGPLDAVERADAQTCPKARTCVFDMNGATVYSNGVMATANVRNARDGGTVAYVGAPVVGQARLDRAAGSSDGFSLTAPAGQVSLTEPADGANGGYAFASASASSAAWIVVGVDPATGAHYASTGLSAWPFTASAGSDNGDAWLSGCVLAACGWQSTP